MSNKILVTGAAGFIGSHLVENLVKNSHNVIAFDRYNTDSNFGWLENSKYRKDIEFVFGDLRDFDSVSKVMKKSKKCIHLAALIGIPYSYISPLAYLKTNVEGTYNILESARIYSHDDVIITSTSEIYGTAQYTPMDEKHPISPQSPYAASKVASDQLAMTYYRSFDLPVKIIRPFNVFGPRQSPRAIIPTIINQLLLGSTLSLGNINVSRDYTYVDDVVNAFIAILESKKVYGNILNVGTNKNIEIKDIIEIVSKKLNRKIKINIDKKRIRPDKSEVKILHCDNSKIQKMTNWKNKNSFNQGINRTIKWNLKFLKEFKSNYYYV